MDRSAYCKYCGGTSFRKGERKDSGGPYQADICNICLSVHRPEPRTPYTTIRAVSTINKAIIILPYSLLLILNELYTNAELPEVISNIDHLLIANKVKDKYISQGQNPCENAKIGHFLKIRFKENTEIDCWVIVHDINQKIAFSISYAGDRGVC